eukprot:GHVQ01023925.1.p1 GENE.GHVQ01023925.1~~GHVQ01023925.1.p1  ORF type:complete len:282 (+),score=31.54 GHVQ01023925.1:187-1032(+)
MAKRHNSSGTGPPPVSFSSRWNFRFDTSSFPPSSATVSHYGTSRPGVVSRTTSKLLDPIGYSFAHDPISDSTNYSGPNTTSSSLGSSPSYFTDMLANLTASPGSSQGLHHRRPGASPTSVRTREASGGPSSHAASSTETGMDHGNRAAAFGELSASSQEILWRRSWEASISPLKSLGMTFFMMYMSGSSSGIFGILIIGYALMNSVKSLLAVSSVFKPFDSIPGMKSTILQKAVYSSICLMGLGYVLYYCNSLGLLPLNSGDYIGLIPEKRFIEKSYGAVG